MATLVKRAPLGGVTAQRSRGYLVYLVILMGLVAVMDQYISSIKITAIPYILAQYQISAADFSWLEAVYLLPTFFIFALNGLNDIIGRRLSILVLVLVMGCSCLAMVLLTPSLTSFMIFYSVAMFTTVSNMWTIPVSEEAPAENRARLVSIVYVLGLIPLQAIFPVVIERLGLDWRWMYGVVFLMMLPVFGLWLFMKETQRFMVVRQEREDGTRRSHFFGLGVIDRRDGWYIAVSAAIWICWLVNSMMYWWAGYFFMTVRGYSLTQWSLVLLATLLMAMAGGVIGGWTMDRLGRRTGLIVGCTGLAVSLSLLGFMSGLALPILAAISGFFTSFAYTWIVVYVPEVFPTERRGACMGWTTTVARVSYVAGPALAAALLGWFPTMEWFWVVAGSIMLVPIALVFVVHPFETRTKELEEIEIQR